MKNSDVKRILKSETIDIPADAKKRTAELAIREFDRTHETENDTSRTEKRSFSGFLARPVMRFAAAALVIALVLTLILSSGGSKTKIGSLVFMVAHAEETGDGSAMLETRTLENGLYVEVPINTKLRIMSVEKGASKRDREATLRRAKTEAQQAISLSRTPYTTYALYGSTAMAYASDSIFSIGIENAENVDSVSILCGSNGFFELSSGDFAHRRRYKNSFRYGSRVQLSEAEFKELYLIDGAEASLLTIWWRPSKAVAESFEKNPSMPLSSVSDRLSVKVTYADGSIGGAEVELLFDDYGVLHASYSSGKAEQDGYFAESVEASAPPAEEKRAYTGELTSYFATLPAEESEVVMKSDATLLPPIWTDCFDDGNYAILAHCEVSTEEYESKLNEALIPQTAELLGIRYANISDRLELVFFDGESGEISAKTSVSSNSHAMKALKIYGDTLYLIEREDADHPMRVLRYSSRGDYLGAVECENNDAASERFAGGIGAIFDSKEPRAIVAEEIEVNGIMHIKRSELELTTGAKNLISRIRSDLNRIKRLPIALYGRNSLEIVMTAQLNAVLESFGGTDWVLTDGESGAYKIEAMLGDSAKYYTLLDRGSGSKLLISESSYDIKYMDKHPSDGNDEKVLMIDLADCSVRELIFDTRSEAFNAKISKDGRIAATISIKADESGKLQQIIRLYDVKTGELIRGFALPDGCELRYPSDCLAIDAVNNRLFITALETEDG
ncbi:MAG: hypothetical protein IKZ82_01430, partial [Clostridia bacterium]|nr:hypothetical protein [Clostridia bacterium]